MNLNQIRERFLQDPGQLETILQELQSTNPTLYEMIQNQPEIIEEALMNPSEPPAPRPSQPPENPNTQLTAEERAAVDRVFVCLIIL